MQEQTIVRISRLGRLYEPQIAAAGVKAGDHQQRRYPPSIETFEDDRHARPSVIDVTAPHRYSRQAQRHELSGPARATYRYDDVLLTVQHVRHWDAALIAWQFEFPDDFTGFFIVGPEHRTA